MDITEKDLENQMLRDHVLHSKETDCPRCGLKMNLMSMTGSWEKQKLRCKCDPCGKMFEVNIKRG